MLRLLATRRWLTWMLVALVWAALCVVAGIWQWHRWQDKSATQHRIDRNYDARPVPFSSVMADGKVPPKADEWKQVEGTGRYVGPTMMVRNRPNSDGDFGYETANVFEVEGIKVLVDRGWVANGRTAAAPASVPAAPSGPVHVVGWVRPAEKSLGRQPVPGQIASLSVKDVEDTTRLDLVDGYVRMRSEKNADGSSPTRPQALDKPSQGMAAGINLSYAFQWWFGAIAGIGFVLLRARREHLDSLEYAIPDESDSPDSSRRPDGSPGPDARPTAPGTETLTSNTSTDDASSPHTAAAPPVVGRVKREKKRKQRIWDEEDE